MINCLMINKDRSVSVIKVNPSRSNFTYNNGLYTIPMDTVNLAEFSDNEKKEPYPEVIYVEGSALPINNVNGKMADFLEVTVIRNALKQTARAKYGFMGIFMDYLRNPAKLLLFTFSLIIAAAVIGGFLFP